MTSELSVNGSRFPSRLSFSSSTDSPGHPSPLPLCAALCTLRYLLSFSEGTFPRVATLPLVEAQAALHARRAPSSRSKLGGSPARHHERHTAHHRLRREPRQRRAPHARL